MADLPNWDHANSLAARSFTCGYCGKVVASDKGFFSKPSKAGTSQYIYICPSCRLPTFFGASRQVPGVAPGVEVEHVPPDVENLYREARNCVAAGAYTASVLAARKLLMNIAVAQGGKPGLKFIEYVDFLAAAGYVPPHGKGWVDHIRKKGNEATHEIALMARPDAEDLITFIEMLLKFIYEFPSRVPKTAP